MRTKRKLLPKSDVNGLGQGNVPSGNVNYVAQHVRVPELCLNIYDPEYKSAERVRNGCQNLESGRMGHLGVSPNTNISTPTSLPFTDDVGNVKRRRLCRVDDVGPSQPARANIDESINIGRGPYVFKISGQLYHWIGSLCPEEGQPPRFLQLYVYDTDNEVDNRINHFGGQNSNLRRDIVEGLIELLDTHKALVHLFITAHEKLADTHVPNFQVRLYNVVGAHEYELPTGDMLGAIVYEPGPETQMDYDIIIEERSGYPQRVNKLHSSYMSLQFPLLFLYGENGYSRDFKLVGDNGRSKTDRRLTMKAYYAYLIHDRKNSYNYLSRRGRLFQQYVVIAFCAIEQNRIDYIREHQNDIRNEYLSGIYDAINRGDTDGSDCGGRLILPQSFTGGPRYMYSHYLDALAICGVHGNPSFFITFTCNIKWSEITEYMADFPLLTTTDRADIVDRVFEMKVQQFVKYLRDAQPFGKTVAVLYTIEFQKRGLPHCHTLLWIHNAARVHRDEDIYLYISAELPSKDTDPECYRIVSELMMHGPCGLAYPFASCTQNGVNCKKHFPKEYCSRTYTDKDGFVHYRRKDTGDTVLKQHVELDNRYVVPYNRELLTRFYAHINVEYCGWTMLIKYLFKYISKGTERIVVRISKTKTTAQESTNRPQIVVDKIKNYLDSRYVSPHEACWRMLEFNIHHREPAVQILSVHLQNMQRVVFRDKDKLDDVVTNTHTKKSTLTEWLHYNDRNTDKRNLTLIYVHPAARDLFYQRMLLCHQKGCRSFPEIRKVNDIVYPTCRAACQALGLLEDDQEWENTMKEAASTATPAELRILFAHILTFCQVTDPVSLWGRIWRTMSEDLPLSQPLLKIVNGLWPTTLPSEDLMAVLKNKLLMEEKSYNRELLAREKDTLHRLAENMHLADENIDKMQKERVSTFAKWLLEIGDGSIGILDECDPENTSWVKIPNIYRVPDDENVMTNLIRFIYDNNMLQYPTPQKLQEKGTPIQANMDAEDTDYFDQLLRLGNTYRISGFGCQKTSTWEQTQTNKTSLIFGKYLQVHSIANDNFPLHYFNFAAYNELAARANMKTAVLTDYIGRIRVVSGIDTFGNATSQRKLRRLIQIENLSGNIIGLALWNEMATGFDMNTYTSLPQPVVIAVSSCYVSRYNGLQLSGTYATHYYLNPDIPETKHIKQHYCFKAIVSDGTATISVTCFSNQANSLIKDVHELLAEISDKDPYHLPEGLKQLEGTAHTFQFHFDSTSTSKRPDFVLDAVFPNIPLALPAPPLEIRMEHPEQPKTTIVPHTTSDTTPIQALNPPSPALSTTGSNEPKKTEIETETPTTPKTTPPTIPLPVTTKEEQKKQNPPTSTAKRVLFMDDPDAKPSDATKKPKHEDPKADT
ncbi:DNA helicase [Tanacetum coccineum]